MKLPDSKLEVRVRISPLPHMWALYGFSDNGAECAFVYDTQEELIAFIDRLKEQVISFNVQSLP